MSKTRKAQKYGALVLGITVAILIPTLPSALSVYFSALLVCVFLYLFWLLGRGSSRPEFLESEEVKEPTEPETYSVPKHRYLKLKKEYGLMRRAFNNAPVAILIINKSRLIHDLNDSALELSGLAYEEVVGKSLGEVFKCAVVGAGDVCGTGKDCSNCPIRSRIDESFKTGKIHVQKRAVLRTVTVQGKRETLWLSISTEKILYEENEMVVVCLSDITSQHKVRAELFDKKQILEHFNSTHQKITRAETLNALFKGVVSNVVLMEPVIYSWASIYSLNGELKELWTPGKEILDAELESIYKKYQNKNIPCLVNVEEVKSLCIFDSNDERCQKWRIFDLFPNRLLAVTPLEISDESLGFISFVLDREVSSEFTSMLTSIVRDIDLKQKFIVGKTALEVSLQQAESAIRAKENFLSVLSHELLTPLNPILGYSRMLQDKCVDHESNEQLREIMSGTQRMSSVIGQMLEFLHLQNNVTREIKEETNLEAVIREVTDRYKENPPQNLFYNITNGGEKIRPIGSTEIFNVDKRIVKSIVEKLLDNAFKFTHEGFVKLFFGYDEVSETIDIVVRDSGVGIEKDKRELIFDQFDAIDTSNSRSSEGIGLGLSICRSYLDLIGGKISVESHIGHGSMFHVKIPVERKAEQDTQAATVDLKSTKRSLSALKALIVDDSSMNRKLLAAILRKLKIQFEEASDGQIALNKCDTTKYDIVLTDIHMPYMTGEQFTRMVRLGYGKNSSSIILGVTADTSDQLRQRAMKNGFDGWILKPVSMNVLEREIRRTLTNKQKEEMV